jgi:uncharacterized protein (TIGR03435 family)
MKTLGLVLIAFVVPVVGADGPAFEVATIKPAAEQLGGGRITRFNGGPGTRDPGRISYINVSFQGLLMAAWNLREDQIIGPGWISSKSFNLEAKLPAGTTEQDLALMLRRLIKERFALRSHEERRVIRGYTLTVTKGGPKLAPGGKSVLNKQKNNDGFPSGAMPTGRFQSLHFPGRARLAGLNVSIEQLSSALAGELRTEVVNATGLSGLYDVSLVFAPTTVLAAPTAVDGQDPAAAAPEFSSEPGIFAAIEKQLGLKLQAGKVRETVLVFDSAEQKPIEE